MTEPTIAPSAAVLRIASRGNDVVRRVVGSRQVAELRAGRLWPVEPVAVTGDEVWDIASITKVAATTAAIMTLVDNGELELTACARDFVPELDSTVTVRDLLEHRSGLREWWPTYLDDLPLDTRYPVGAERHYSDLGFMLLARVVSTVAGKPYDRAVAELVIEPLGLPDAHFRPYGRGLDRPLVATTHGDWIERDMVATGEPYPVGLDPDSFAGWRPYTVVGEVSDGNAWHRFHGVAGHAGLFASADDLVIFGRALLSSVDGRGPWSRRTVTTFFTPSADAEQAVGFRLWPSYGAIGHTGFTGCGFAILPALDRIVVLLTNRTHTPIGSQASVRVAWEGVLAKPGEGEWFSVGVFGKVAGVS
ncbi:serine hydrolase domain-containing protein [Fodinicola acaciae]|uniref:serine hydrolase domain-containing protein n=1 Tax=Fodinicola acaciae TaxID=2681555 RepID=UPI0013D8DDBB|nr:serine hydrolase [Fodinicola acaciae]